MAADLCLGNIDIFFRGSAGGFYYLGCTPDNKGTFKNNYLGWTFGGLWAIGWVAAILFAASVVKDFREYEHTDTAIAISQPANGKMIVAVSEPELEYTGSFDWMNDGGEGWDLSSDTLKFL